MFLQQYIFFHLYDVVLVGLCGRLLLLDDTYVDFSQYIQMMSSHEVIVNVCVFFYLYESFTTRE